MDWNACGVEGVELNKDCICRGVGYGHGQDTHGRSSADKKNGNVSTNCATFYGAVVTPCLGHCYYSASSKSILSGYFRPIRPVAAMSLDLGGLVFHVARVASIEHRPQISLFFWTKVTVDHEPQTKHSGHGLAVSGKASTRSQLVHEGAGASGIKLIGLGIGGFGGLGRTRDPRGRPEGIPAVSCSRSLWISLPITQTVTTWVFGADGARPLYMSLSRTVYRGLCVFFEGASQARSIRLSPYSACPFDVSFTI
ncbi:hypothetical protein BDV95DRAFT_592462 [Massariosphaeria phaeospora]|uniref:Uncharacterized protein n=1 Tax=Massariosphaeria phaeospora TaxID=100035 RepID=A0A7C8IDJ5_9PLEO|nr:hypothetical protein BDV95DRAFT_592462 [Massariosphaeria phaeospora]